MRFLGNPRHGTGQNHLAGGFRKNVRRGINQIHAAAEDAQNERDQQDDHQPAIVVAASAAEIEIGPPMRAGRRRSWLGDGRDVIVGFPGTTGASAPGVASAEPGEASAGAASARTAETE